MQEPRKPLPYLASIRLEHSATLQLDELAQYHDRSFDQVATMAIHFAYLTMLEDKRNEAIQALDRQLGGSDLDDEIPF